MLASTPNKKSMSKHNIWMASFEYLSELGYSQQHHHEEILQKMEQILHAQCPSCCTIKGMKSFNTNEIIKSNQKKISHWTFRGKECHMSALW